jgi:lipocalin
MKFYTAITTLFATASALSPQRNQTVGKLNPDTVDELVLDSYVGLWYQMAADAIVYDTFEKDSFCDTALYGYNTDGTISVHNYAKIGSPDGSTYIIDGYAYGSNAEEPGQLKVHFDSDEAAPFDAPYWVLALGPVNVDNQYDWAIVSDNFSAFLFVLARDVATYNAKYKDEVMSMLDDLGFKGRTAPIETYQGSDCVYE